MHPVQQVDDVDVRTSPPTTGQTGPMTLPPLPAGLIARPPTMADADEAAALLRRDELHSTGDPHTTSEDIRSDWSRPSMDLSHDVILVHDGDRLVGYADHSDGRGWVAVDPDCHGRGIGTWLLHWTEQRARDDGQARIGQTVADVHHDAVELLRRHGYARRWASWVFSITLDGDLPAPALPDGLVVREMVRPDEDAAVHEVIETSFSEWPDREQGMSFEDWRAAHLDRDDVVVLVVVDEEAGRVIGAAVCLDEGLGEGWVEQLAVARSGRGRGLGRALLQAAFRHFRDRDCRTAGLSTDSRTGAKTLYEHVGMTVTLDYARWSKELGDEEPGKE
jgi:mycothiol synthase